MEQREELAAFLVNVLCCLELLLDVAGECLVAFDQRRGILTGTESTKDQGQPQQVVVGVGILVDVLQDFSLERCELVVHR